MTQRTTFSYLDVFRKRSKVVKVVNVCSEPDWKKKCFEKIELNHNMSWSVFEVLHQNGLTIR